MSRHRDIRGREGSFCEEYEYDDVYGHSVEDDHYGVSPATAEMYMYSAARGTKPLEFPEPIEEIQVDEADSPDEDGSPFEHSLNLSTLNPLEKGQLESCLLSLQEVVGDTLPESVLREIILANRFDVTKSLNQALCSPRKAKKEQNTSDTQFTFDNSAVSDLNMRLTETNLKEESKHDSMTSVTSSTDLNDSTPTSNLTTKSTPKSASKMQANLNLSAILDTQTTPKSSKSGTSFTPSQRSTPSRSLLTIPPTSGFKPDAKIISSIRSSLEMEKERVNLVVIGHVDAGKSTLMGHLLYLLGNVEKRTMHKCEQDSKRVGKSSFAFAWILDETEEERSRGITMDIAETQFETPSRRLTLLDAPGHKDFIPAMITGTAQADAALLVVDACKGAFESGFKTSDSTTTTGSEGQTSEHALLARSLGISQLIVAVNKLDIAEWSESRYNFIRNELSAFLLKKAGFRNSDLVFVPCSGLTGENLIKISPQCELTSWYSGPTLVDCIDRLISPIRLVETPLRVCISDVVKTSSQGVTVAGTIEAGYLLNNDKVLVLPVNEVCSVKSISVNDSQGMATAGDRIVCLVTLDDALKIGIGSVLCHPAYPIAVCQLIEARVVIFNIDQPVIRGAPIEFHTQSLCEPAYIKKLIAFINKATGEPIRGKKLRALSKGISALVEIHINKPVALDLYTNSKNLGRFMLRQNSKSVAAGIVCKIIA